LPNVSKFIYFFINPYLRLRAFAANKNSSLITHNS
jgi:hypothetical protein